MNVVDKPQRSANVHTRTFSPSFLSLVFRRCRHLICDGFSRAQIFSAGTRLFPGVFPQDPYDLSHSSRHTWSISWDACRAATPTYFMLPKMTTSKLSRSFSRKAKM